MKTTTITATIARIGGLARRSAGSHLLGAASFDDVDLVLGGTGLDVDHGEETVGQIVHLEVDRQDRVHLVGVVDGLRLGEVDQPVYVSGSWEMRGRGSDLRQRSSFHNSLSHQPGPSSVIGM